MTRRQIDERLTIGLGGPPSPEEIHDLAADRFRTVVDFRLHDEAPLPPREEARHAEAAGLAYVHLPVSGRMLGPEAVDRFRQVLAAAEGPVLVHCAGGGRAATVALSGLAAEHGWDGEHAARRFQELGLPGSPDFVRAYAEQAKWTDS
jgi:uncharacterized protein (TIGR01244 family)